MGNFINYIWNNKNNNINSINNSDEELNIICSTCFKIIKNNNDLLLCEDCLDKSYNNFFNIMEENIFEI